MPPIQPLQQDYLEKLIKDQNPVTLYFKNGRKIIGKFMGMTQEVIFFKRSITEYFYKTQIHSIKPVSCYTAKT